MFYVTFSKSRSLSTTLTNYPFNHSKIIRITKINETRTRNRAELSWTQNERKRNPFILWTKLKWTDNKEDISLTWNKTISHCSSYWNGNSEKQPFNNNPIYISHSIPSRDFIQLKFFFLLKFIFFQLKSNIPGSIFHVLY